MSISQAQLHEAGIFVGGTNYVGDIGKTDYISPNKLAGGIIYKRNINRRIALRGRLSYLPIKANDADANNSFRKNRNFIIENNTIQNHKFENNIIEFAVGIEYNFFEYDISSSRKTFTPYILLELAGITYEKVELDSIKKYPNSKKLDNLNYNDDSSFAFAVPFGLGFKMKLLNNITFAIETKFRYTFKDDLDSAFGSSTDDNTLKEKLTKVDTNRRYTEAIKKFEEFENSISGSGNDWYMFTGFLFVYTFGKYAGRPIWFPK